jgi:hypothetical protein
MTNEVFLAQFRAWIRRDARIAGSRPGTGRLHVASAMQLWLWTLGHLRHATDADGAALYKGSRQGVTFPLADALCWLLAARAQILDVLELDRRSAAEPGLAEGLGGFAAFFADLCHVQSASAAGEVGRVCAELVHGYTRHPAWDAAGLASCCQAEEIDEIEGVMPGFIACARAFTDVVETDGTHAAKAGPCAKRPELGQFIALRARLDGCLTGCRLAKDRAAEALTRVSIPEALDYPSRRGRLQPARIPRPDRANGTRAGPIRPAEASTRGMAHE